MGAKYEKLMADMQAELDGKKPEETTTTTTQTEETVTETPADEHRDEPEHTEDHAEERRDEPETEQDPEKREPERHDTQERREIPDDPVKRAEFAFKRQLSKQKEKHDAELKERDEKYEKLLKEIEALKKAQEPKHELKREDFPDDEEFIRALQEDAMKKAFAERDAADAKKAAEAAEAARKKEAEERELRETQEQWLHNVDEAFGADKQRANAFLTKIQYANNNGLGEILDNCPVASDYLMHDPMGPVVFEKILTDKPTFDRVFDMRRLSPMNIFYQLKKVEDEILNPVTTTADQAPAKPTMPHLGKPGRQAAGSSMTNNDMFSDPKAVKKWLREHR